MQRGKRLPLRTHDHLKAGANTRALPAHVPQQQLSTGRARHSVVCTDEAGAQDIPNLQGDVVEAKLSSEPC